MRQHCHGRVCGASTAFNLPGLARVKLKLLDLLGVKVVIGVPHGGVLYPKEEEHP
jgi:hypothetical protein